MVKFIRDADGTQSQTIQLLEGNYIGLLLRVSGSGASAVSRPTGNVIMTLQGKGAIITVPFDIMVDITNILYGAPEDTEGTSFRFSALIPFTMPNLANALSISPNEAELTLPSVDGASSATWEVYGILSDNPERYIPRIHTRTLTLSGNLNEPIDIDNILALFLSLGSGATAPTTVLVKTDEELKFQVDWDVMESITNIFSRVETTLTDKLFFDLNPNGILSTNLEDHIVLGASGGSGSLKVTVFSAEFDDVRAEASAIKIVSKAQHKVYKRFTRKSRAVPVAIRGELEQLRVRAD